MARELRPTVLDDLGLVAAAQSYTEHCAELLGFAVTFHAESSRSGCHRRSSWSCTA